VSRTLAWFVHLSNAAVGLTGLVYAWMRYAMEPGDPYSVVAHPAQPFVQHTHLWAAPFAVFAVGLIWQQHVWKHWRRRLSARRRTGLMLMTTAAPMILSGYLIQTAVTPTWRTVWIVAHLGTSALWVAGYLGHALLKKNGTKSSMGRTAPAD
jgi:hypothetical protein